MDSKENTVNGNQALSPESVFSTALKDASRTGDFDFVIATAKQSHKMLIDFRDAIQTGLFEGNYSMPLAQGLQFIEQMIGQAAAQVQALRNAEKTTQETIKKSAPAREETDV